MGVMGNRRHDRAEIRRLLELRQSEKLTYSQIAERSGIPVHVLRYRAAQDRGRDGDTAADPASFVEVVRAMEPEADLESSGIELVLPGGVRALLARQFDDAALGRLLAVARC
jgi:transposase-like protein